MGYSLLVVIYLGCVSRWRFAGLVSSCPSDCFIAGEGSVRVALH